MVLMQKNSKNHLQIIDMGVSDHKMSNFNNAVVI